MTSEISYTPEEVAQILKISRYTVYELIKRGELVAYRIGRKVRVELKDLERYKQQAKGGEPAPEGGGQGAVADDGIREGALIVCGQDMVLDVLTRWLERQLPGIPLYRNHAGSMNGLWALYHRKANVVTAHLWDGDSDDYNVSYVRRMLPGQRTLIYNLLYRQEGFYVAKGNPLGLRQWEDLTRPGLRFVNRELGSGARVLLDEQLRRHGIDPQQIGGYETEESSHLSVASCVARGDCDVGLGIEKAALQIENIDFVPLKKERVDIIFRREDADKPPFRALLEVLTSDAFRKEIQGMGGYDVSRMGKLMAET